MRAITNLAVKDLRILWRDRVGLFWVIAFPLLIALFFGSIFGGSGTTSRSLKIAYTTASTGAFADSFREELKSIDVLAVQIMSPDSARDLVTRGKLVAYVEVIDTSDSGPFAIFTGDGPAIEVGIDPSRRAESGYLKGLINQAYFSVLKSQISNTSDWRTSIRDQLTGIDTSTSLDDDQRSILSSFLTELDTFLGAVETDSALDGGTTAFAEPNINFEDIAVARTGPRSAFEITFPQSLQWALIACAASFALSIVTERTRGTWLRLRLAPVGKMQILAGKGLACFTASVCVVLILLAIGVSIFGVRVAWPTGLAISIVAAAFCFVGLMMIISVLGKTEAAVGGGGWAIFLIFSMTGGGMVPLAMMPGWMQQIGSISPVKWSILAFEGVIWRGFGWSELMLPIGILVGIGLVGFIVGTAILLRSDN